MSEETTTVIVKEDKFNGTSTMSIYGIDDKDTVKRLARKYFEDQYGHSLSKVVAEKKYHAPNNNEWEVMVADHSSGSLKDSESYEVKE